MIIPEAMLPKWVLCWAELIAAFHLYFLERGFVAECRQPLCYSGQWIQDNSMQKWWKLCVQIQRQDFLGPGILVVTKMPLGLAKEQHQLFSRHLGKWEENAGAGNFKTANLSERWGCNPGKSGQDPHKRNENSHFSPQWLGKWPRNVSCDMCSLNFPV